MWRDDARCIARCREIQRTVRRESGDIRSEGISPDLLTEDQTHDTNRAHRHILSPHSAASRHSLHACMSHSGTGTGVQVQVQTATATVTATAAGVQVQVNELVHHAGNVK